MQLRDREIRIRQEANYWSGAVYVIGSDPAIMVDVSVGYDGAIQSAFVKLGPDDRDPERTVIEVRAHGQNPLTTASMRYGYIRECFRDAPEVVEVDALLHRIRDEVSAAIKRFIAALPRSDA